MKKLFISLCLTLISMCGFANMDMVSNNLIDLTPQYTVVNDSTVLFYNIDKLDIHTKDTIHIIYVYEYPSSTLICAKQGAFTLDLCKGNYLIMATRPITNAWVEDLIERVYY